MDEMNGERKIALGEEVEAATTEEQAGEQSKDNNQQDPDRKYTDADVDKIIARKIAAERNRMSKLFNEEQQESEIEKRERNVLKRELMADAKDNLLNDGYPSSLASLMRYDSKEEFEQSYQEVTAIFGEATKQGLRDALKGQTPRTGGTCLRGNDPVRDAFAPKAR